MTEKDIFKLPNHKGIAETMSDFFEPDHEKMATHIVIKEGLMRVGKSVLWTVMVATNMTGKFNLIILTKNSKELIGCEANTLIVNDLEFEKIVQKFYLF